MQTTNLQQGDTQQCCSTEQLNVWRDILAQAVTGEFIGALNYETLAEICDDPGEKEEANEHAQSERGHAMRFHAAGRAMGLDVTANLEAPYWKRIRDAFLGYARANDFVACVIAQEVMLESFAVASYQMIGAKAPGKLGATFAQIANEEGEHIGHAIEMLQAERGRDADAFDAKVQDVHESVMTTLAEMVAREDPAGHCGLCAGHCVKPSLPCVALTAGELRGASLQRYLQTLDEIGLPGDSTLGWIARLPV